MPENYFHIPLPFERPMVQNRMTAFETVTNGPVLRHVKPYVPVFASVFELLFFPHEHCSHAGGTDFFPTGRLERPNRAVNCAMRPSYELKHGEDRGDMERTRELAASQNVDPFPANACVIRAKYPRADAVSDSS